jgi:hypothetical protein
LIFTLHSNTVHSWRLIDKKEPGIDESDSAIFTITVNSTAIAAIGYENGVLAVTFHNTGTYFHPGVPYSVYAGLMRATSMGAYYNRYIRGRYH